MNLQKFFIIGFLIISLFNSQFYAAPISTLYSTIDFPFNQSYINTNQPTITGSLLDADRKAVINKTLQILIDGVVVGITASDDNGTYRFFVEAVIPDGHHEVAVFCVDSQTILTSNQFTIDTTLPPIIILYPQEDQIIADNTLMVSGTTEENAMVITFLDDDTYGSTCYADEKGSWSIEYIVESGKHTLTAQATDIAGNQGPISELRRFSINS